MIFHEFPTNDAWCRDHGAIFVTRSPGQPAAPDAPLRALDFQYNAWGGKYPPFEQDNAMPARMAAALGVPWDTLPLVLEGGSIEVNGAGLLLTTEQCLCNPNRNPGLTRGDRGLVARSAGGDPHSLAGGGHSGGRHGRPH